MSADTENSSKKLILVIGATGAQGLAVIDKLLAPCEDGSPSPYTIRALTRTPESRRAKELAARGVECVEGQFDNFRSVAAALKGAYGAWVNTDSFTVGEEKEVWCGIRIFELAKQAGIKHYVWSNSTYVFKLTNYNPAYRSEHNDGKGRVGDFLRAQPSAVSDTDMTWTTITTAPYMDMLYGPLFGPLKRRDDGTAVFATPIGSGHVPMLALSDLGFFARYVFDNRATTSGVDLDVATDWVGWDYLISTFEKVTGQKAEVINQTFDEWFDNFENANRPLAMEYSWGDGSTTWRDNYTAWWSIWRDDVIRKDWEWIRKVNPKGHTLETWMRAGHYGEKVWKRSNPVLKNSEDGKGAKLDRNRVERL